MSTTEHPLRKQLEEKRQALKRRVTKINTHLRQEEGPLDANFSEQAQELENEEILQALDDAGRLELAKIERALQAMDQGEYGICEDCGKKIGLPRLTAIPHAPLCIKCAEAQEKR